jgi:hypothetical protein
MMTNFSGLAGESGWPGNDDMIKKKFAEKFGKQNWRFSVKNSVIFCKNLDHNIGF